MKKNKLAFRISIQAFGMISILILHSCATTTGNLENEDKSRAIRTLGYSLYQQGKAREALNHLLDAEKIDSSNPELQHILALAYQEIDEYDLAFVHFKKAIKLKPDFSEVYNNMGILYSLLEESDKALESFNKAVSNMLYRTPHFAYHNMGLIYYQKKEIEKAIYYFKKSIDLEPNFIKAYIDLGIAYEDSGRYEEAISINKKIMLLIPNSLEPHLNLAKLYLKTGHKKEAVEELKSIISTDPRHPVARNAMEMLDEIQ